MSTNGVASSSDQLNERLNDPKTVDALNRLLDRLDTVTFAIESLEGFVSRGEVIAESVAASVNDMKERADEKTLEMIQKAPRMLETGARLAAAAEAIHVDELAQSKVLERLTEPQTLATLNQLLDRLPLAAFVLESLEGFINRGETIADNLSDAVGELNLSEAKLDTRQITALLEALPRFKEAGEKLLESNLLGEGLPKVLDAGVSMVDSGMLDQEVVTILGELGKKSSQAYQEAAAKPVEPVGGMWATLRATRDPDVQKSLGFFFAFAKAFAKHLK